MYATTHQQSTAPGRSPLPAQRSSAALRPRLPPSTASPAPQPLPQPLRRPLPYNPTAQPTTPPYAPHALPAASASPSPHTSMTTAEGAGAGAGASIAARLRRALAPSSSSSSADPSGSGLPPPPFPALNGSELGSFAHATITSRLPAILEGMIRDVEAEAVAGQLPDASAKEVSACLAELGALRAAMLADAPLPPLQVAGASAQTQVLLDAANASVELAAARLAQAQGQGQQSTAAVSPGGGAGAVLRATWLGLPWLTVECYMYAAIHAALQRHPALAALDPFRRQKAAAWAKSAAAAADMASEVEMLLHSLRPGGGAAAAAGIRHSDLPSPSPAEAAEAAARLAAEAGVRIALWGNKADLSLLAGAAGLEEHHLAAPPEAATPAAAATDGAADGSGSGGVAAVPASHIIVDEGEAVWGAMARLRARRAGGGAGEGSAAAAAAGVRVDIVLDNSGLELFADLCLADLLLEAGVADRVVLHGKVIPWFVSDTLAGDLEGLLASCEGEQPPGGQLSPAAWEPVRRLAARWRRHLTPAANPGGGGNAGGGNSDSGGGGDGTGAWSWAAHPFWTMPAPFAWMAALAPDLYDDLSRSELVIFKGDLNYRKLTHDCRWPHTTPFEEALQGFRPAPLVALRTLKADVAVGLPPGLDAALDCTDPDWLVNGKWGMVQAAL